MNKEKIKFDAGFKEGVEDFHAKRPDRNLTFDANNPYRVGYLIGVIYAGEGKPTHSSEIAWKDVNEAA